MTEVLVVALCLWLGYHVSGLARILFGFWAMLACESMARRAHRRGMAELDPVFGRAASAGAAARFDAWRERRRTWERRADRCACWAGLLDGGDHGW